MHPNEWPVVASSDLLYITDAAIFEDDPSFSKRTAGWHECPERYDERTCWSTSDSFVLFLTLPALLIHFPLLLCHLLRSSVFLPQLCCPSSCCQLSFLRWLSPFCFVIIHLFLSLSYFNSISSPIFLFVWLPMMMCLLSSTDLFIFVLVLTCWKGHGGGEGGLTWTSSLSKIECLDSASVLFSVV